MSKISQNLVVLMEASQDADDIHLKGGHMCMNRFCIDEDAAIELSGVHVLKKSWESMTYDEKFNVERKLKGKGHFNVY